MYQHGVDVDVVVSGVGRGMEVDGDEAYTEDAGDE